MTTATTYFYIYKLLEINHKQGGTSYIPLTRNRGYFYDTPYDSDEDNYHDKVRDYQTNILDSTFKPILIYNSASSLGFIRPLYREKYATRIDQKINCPQNQDWYFTAWKDVGTPLTNWNNIATIYKIEKREMARNFTAANPYVDFLRKRKPNGHN